MCFVCGKQIYLRKYSCKVFYNKLPTCTYLSKYNTPRRSIVCLSRKFGNTFLLITCLMFMSLTTFCHGTKELNVAKQKMEINPANYILAYGP